jgi:hypothetical protein
MIKSWMVGCSGHVAFPGEIRNPCKIVVEKLQTKREVVRSWSRWEYNIKMVHKDLIHLPQHRVQ